MTTGSSMRFVRDLAPYAEPVSVDALVDGSTYFSVTFVDDDMLIPVVQTLVYIGRDLNPGDRGFIYFQDVDSYLQGIRHSSAKKDDDAMFVVVAKDKLNNVFEYEPALDVLIRCLLRRKSLGRRVD